MKYSIVLIITSLLVLHAIPIHAKSTDYNNITTAHEFTMTNTYIAFTQINADSVSLLIDKSKEIENISKNILNKEQHATLLRLMGNVFYYKNLVEIAMRYFESSLEVFQTVNNKKEIGRTLSNIAVLNEIIGDYNHALELHFQALKTMQELGDEKGRSFVLNNIAVVYAEMDNYEKALDYYSKSFAIKMQLTDSIGIASTSNNIGVLYGEQFHDVDSMQYYLQKSMDIYQAIGDSLKYAKSRNNLSESYVSMGLLKKAKENSEEALEICRMINETRTTAYCCRNLAEIEMRQDNLLLAKKYLEESETILSSLNDNTKLLEILQLKQELLIKQGHIEESVSNFKRFIAIKDSLENSKVELAIANAEARYKIFEKESRIGNLEKETKIKSQRIILFVTLSVSLLLLFIVGLLFYHRNKRQNQQKQETLRQQLLRSQMNPHFLFNALGSIQNFMLKNETSKAAGYLNNFASLTRNILEHSDQEFVSVSDEVDTLRNYMELEKMRLQNRFDFEITYDKDLEIDFINIPPMLIQPFVENAIKHGLNNIDYKGLLELKFEEKDAVLHIEIADNGVGIDHGKKNKSKLHQSMSMNIFEQRRIVLAKRTKQAIGLEVCDRRKINPLTTGTLVKIEIPILN